MITILHPDDRSFLLGDAAGAFKRAVAGGGPFRVPADWRDAFFDQAEIDLGAYDDLFIVRRFLAGRRLLLDAYANDELPRNPAQTVQMLLRGRGRDPSALAWDEASFTRRLAAEGLRRDAATAGAIQRRKLLALDARLREACGLRLVLLLQHTVVPPEQIAEPAVIGLLLRPDGPEHRSVARDYTIGDAATLLRHHAVVHMMQVDAWRYEAYLKMPGLADAIAAGHYAPPPRTYALGGGLIAMSHALFPRLGRVLDFADQDWDGARVLILHQDAAGVRAETTCVPWFQAVAAQYLANREYLCDGYVCDPGERRRFGFRLCVVWSDEVRPVLTREQALAHLAAAG